MDPMILKAIIAHEEIDASLHAQKNEEDRKIRKVGSKRNIHFGDWRDESRHPSYTNFRIPYHITCARRYDQSKQLYEDQFQYEINQLCDYMSSAGEVVSFMRHVAYTSLWPPLHTRKEIQSTSRYFYRVTPKERERLNFIMKNEIV